MAILQSFLPIYTTNITIGTPPQPFSIAIDLIASTLFVPSTSCDYNICDEGYQRYNASLSSTYTANGSYINAEWASVSYTGHVSRDTLHISDLALPSTLFEEWTNANCMFVGCIKGGSKKGGYDGVLPLSPPWKPSQIPNTLSVLLSQNLLSAPIFSLKLPRSQSDTGELLLGGTNPALHTAPPVTIPITNVTRPFQQPFANLWTVKPTHITFDTATTNLFHQTLNENYTAVLDAANPWLILPSRLARNLTAAIGAQPGPSWFRNVPCSSRAYLPTVTFGLGGHNFTIDAFDYTHEVDYPNIGLICITTFWAADEFGMERRETLLLGSAFLKGFYGVFDMERKEVGCEYSRYLQLGTEANSF
jgi:hypothetical protein